MTTIWLLARASTSRVRSWVPALMLMAVCAGIVMAAAAGARRTDTAYSRFLAATTSPDLVIPYANSSPQDPGAEPMTIERISRLPQVSAFSRAYAPAMEGRTDTGQQISSETTIQPVALEDHSPQPKVAGLKVLEGRLVDPNRADEAVAGLSASQAAGLHPGSTLHLRFSVQRGPDARGGRAGGRSPGGAPPPNGAPGPGGAVPSGGVPPPAPAGPEVTIHVVGVVVSSGPGDFGVSASRQSSVYLTSAFAHRYADRLTNVALIVQLRHGAADLPAFKSEAEKVAGGGIFYLSLSDSRAATQSSIHLQAVALALFAALGALVCLIVAGQAVVRQVLANRSESAVLRSLGVSPSQLWLAAVLPAGLVGVAAALLAVPLAVLLSPLTPLGVARVAEPTPGIAVDAPVLGLGALGIIAATLLVAAYPAWRAARAAAVSTDLGSRGSRTGAVIDTLSRSGLPPSAASGVRLALVPGAGRSRAPVLAALTGCAIGIAAIAAALTFRASLDHLLSTPRLYGWGWDAEVSPNWLPDPTTPVPAGPEIVAVAGGTTRELSIDGERVEVVGVDQLHGLVEPVITEGRTPANDGEILLGTSTGAGHRLGDQVQVGSGGSSQRLTIVGRGLIPAATGTSRLGSGALTTFGGIRSILGAAAAPAYDVFPVVLAPGTDLARETRAWEASYGGPGSVHLPSPPRSLADFGDVDQLPGILAAVLVLAGVGALAHALITAARRRRRELAILKTLGFTQRQVVATVLWQSVTLAAVAAVIGLPLGIAAGRWAWSLFATTQGTLVETVVPLTVSLLVAPLAVAAAVVVGLMPGWIAATVRPALVLRSE